VAEQQSSMYKIILTNVVGVIILTYPLLIYCGFRLNIIAFLLPFIVIIFLLRLFLISKHLKILALQSMLFTLCAVLLLTLSCMLKSQELALYYPVCTNVILFILFFGSYFTKESFITTLAKLKDKNLSEKAINYTRKVTLLWSFFFIVNGSMALFTVLYGSLELWTLYNGLISYILIVILFLGEFIVRIKKQSEFR